VSSTGHIRIDERVIAPVPESEGLKHAFMRQGYAKALPLVGQAGSLIALGYRFSPYDRVSYKPVLEALAQSHERTLLVVSPQARELAKRICAECPDLRVRRIRFEVFSAWQKSRFPQVS
jgi:hypothetical protein